MKVKIFTVLLSMFAFCVFYCPGEALSQVKGEAQNDTGQVSSESPTVGTPAQKIYIDPETGEFTVPPDQAPSLVEESSVFPDEELEETPSPVPNGGMIIDLKGHFRPSLIIKHDAGKKEE
ncbi:MAG: hypothetical protein JRI62_02050 [Deltaproteobacteria bacterium]|nr:hypothetical protein [Deltaproteobacteria bacterium]MBW1833598.1 hypothetical protein [Deltaproteobacteria bacterium]